MHDVAPHHQWAEEPGWGVIPICSPRPMPKRDLVFVASIALIAIAILVASVAELWP